MQTAAKDSGETVPESCRVLLIGGTAWKERIEVKVRNRSSQHLKTME